MPADRILGFARLLRANGIPASPAEAADALRALVTVPEALDRRETFAAVLGASLVKRAADLPRFRDLFDAYFLPRARVADDQHHHHHHHHNGQEEFAGVDLLPKPGPAIDGGTPGHQHGTRIDLRRFFGEGYARPDHDHHPSDRLRLTWLGGDLLYDQAGGAPPVAATDDGTIGLARVSTAGQPGALRPPSAAILPRGVVLGGEDGRANGPPVDEGYNGAMDGRRRTMAATDHWPADVQDATPSLPDLSWDRLSVEEIVCLERALGRLGRKLGGAPGRRREARRGRLDGRATARRAAATGGVPFAPVYRARRDDRPRLVVLCDASLSVRGAARFLLALARSAQRQNGRVRSFVFVREVAEATAALAGPDLERAIETIYGGRLLDTAEASDGGAALATFLERHGSILTPRTTLLILGDGRNNGRDPRMDVLIELRRRGRRVVWLTPEGRGSWRLAGCDLPRYEAVCDLVTTVRTPADVERMVTGLTW